MLPLPPEFPEMPLELLIAIVTNSLSYLKEVTKSLGTEICTRPLRVLKLSYDRSLI